MKANRRFRSIGSNTEAGIGTYVLILFGMTFMLYMFGFTNTWVQYITPNPSATGDINLTNGEMQQQNATNPLLNIFRGVMTFIQTNLFLAGSGMVGLAMFFITARLFKIDVSAIMTYIIPVIIITIVLNIFVFPISSMASEFRDMSFNGIPIAVFFLAFFNLIYILALLEWVRGTPI